MTSHVRPKDGLFAVVALLAFAAAAIGFGFSAGKASAAGTEVQGTLRVAHSDDFAGKQSRFYYSLRAKGRTLKVVPGSSKLRAKLDRAGMGAKLKLRGERSGSTVTADSATELPTARVVDPPDSIHKVAVIMVAPGGVRANWSEDSIRGTVFGTVNDFFKRQSNGQLELRGGQRADGDVFGWYDIAKGSGCAADAWARDAIAAAEADHGSLASYDNVIIAFPSQSACSWAGMGTIGAIGYHGRHTVWANGYIQYWSVIAHELGHNVGLHHANTYSCTSGSKRVAISSSCTTKEYGDPFDVMGNGGDCCGGGGTFNAQHNGHLGPMGEFPALPTQNADASGDYNVSPMIPGSLATQALRIKKSGSGATALYYYLQTDWNNSLRITIGNAYDQDAIQTQLIDTTPTTASFGDGGLAVGKTFADAAAGVTVTNNGAGPDGTVAVHVGGGDTVPPPPTDTTPPSITITSPADGAQVSGTVPITATVTDAGKVKRTEIYVDGQRIFRRGNANVKRNWRVGAKRYALGPHTITVTALDDAGNTNSASITVVK